MAEIVGVELQVNGGNAEQTVKSFRTQLREATAELVRIQEKFGDISPEAQKAAKQVAELRDRLKDANEVSALFDPEKKFQAIVGAAQGIASGFAAVQGAMALVGSESKEVEQAILKVQAAMALAQGLSGLKAGIEDFKRLGAVLGNISIVQKANAAANTLAANTMRLFGVSTTQTGVAFTVLKGAIIASGIGLLVVVLGTAINRLVEFTGRTNDAADAQRELNKAIVDNANKNADEIADIFEKDKQLQIARAKARGASEAEIVEITKRANDEIIKERLRVKTALEVQGKDTTEAQKALQKAETDAELFELGQREKNREASEAKTKAAREKAAADAKAKRDKEAQEREQANQAAEQAEQQTANEIFNIQHTAEENELHALAEKFRQRREAYVKAGRDIGELLVAQAIERGEIERKYAAERQEQANADFLTKSDKLVADQNAQTQREKEYAEARKRLAQEEANAKIMAAESVSNALAGFAALAGEQTAAGKAFAVASATIQAILGAQQAFTALSAIPIVGPALGVVAAAGAIAAGIANVKKILSVPVPGQASAGGGSLPSLSSTAPVAPQAPTPQTTRLDQTSINSIGNATIRAYVVESDVTGKQDRIRRIQNAARFK